MLVATHTHTHTHLLLVLRVTLCRSGDYEQIWCTFNWLCIIIVLLLLLIRIMTLHSPQFIAREWVMQGMWVMQELLLLLSPFPSPSSAIICHHHHHHHHHHHYHPRNVRVIWYLYPKILLLLPQDIFPEVHHVLDPPHPSFVWPTILGVMCPGSRKGAKNK